MTNNRKAEGEPFFWIKTGQRAENPARKRPEKLKSIEKPVIVSTDRAIPPPTPDIINETARAGLQPGWIRASFIVREDYLAKLKKKAYWDRKAIKDVLDEILAGALAPDSRSNFPGNIENKH